MTTELWALTGVVMLAMAQMGLATTFSKRQTGNKYSIGPRDELIVLAGLAGRFDRALKNLNESLPLFTIVIMTAHVTEKNNDWTALAAQAFLLARIAYVAAYASGIPWVRTVVWQISMLAVVAIIVQLFY